MLKRGENREITRIQCSQNDSGGTFTGFHGFADPFARQMKRRADAFSDSQNVRWPPRYGPCEPATEPCTANGLLVCDALREMAQRRKLTNEAIEVRREIDSSATPSNTAADVVLAASDWKEPSVARRYFSVE